MKSSVIMSVYNERLDYIEQAIESILQQTYTDFECLICLDAPDKTDTWALLEQFAQRDQRVKIIKNPENIGLVASLNKLLPMCQGDYIFRMDADDIAFPTRFEEQLSFMETEDIDFCSTLMAIIDEEGNEIRRQPSLGRHYKTEEIYQLIRYRNILGHPNWCVKRTVYEQLGGYRNLVPAEDYDFIIRAAQHGFKMGLLDRVLFYYRNNTKGISRSNVYQQHLYAYAMQYFYEQKQPYSEDDFLQVYEGYLTEDFCAERYLSYYLAFKEQGLFNLKNISQAIQIFNSDSFARDLLANDYRVIWLKMKFKFLK